MQTPDEPATVASRQSPRRFAVRLCASRTDVMVMLRSVHCDGARCAVPPPCSFRWLCSTAPHAIPTTGHGVTDGAETTQHIACCSCEIIAVQSLQPWLVARDVPCAGFMAFRLNGIDGGSPWAASMLLRPPCRHPCVAQSSTSASHAEDGDGPTTQNEPLA